MRNEKQNSIGRLSQVGIFMFAVLALYALSAGAFRIEARRTNIQGGNTYGDLFDGSVSTFQIDDTHPATSTAVPVGLVEDVAAEISIRGLAASQSVTVRTLGLINSNDNTVGYHVPMNTAPETVFDSGDDNAIIQVSWSGGIETLKWTFEASQNTSVSIDFVVGTQ